MHEKKTALITGASGGIGLEFAHIFAREGYDLVLVARDEGRLKELAQELGEKYHVATHPISSDLSHPTAPAELYDQLVGKGIQIDALVNNAGFGHFGLFAESPWEKERGMIALNIAALTHLTKLLLPGMLERKRGNILNVASIAAFEPGPLMAVYYASKAYVLSFSEAIANELEGTGVFVTVLCPGPTATSFEKTAALGESKLFKQNLATAKDVAEYGYREMKKGTIVAVHSLRNRLILLAIKFSPRALVVKMVRRAQEVK